MAVKQPLKNKNKTDEKPLIAEYWQNYRARVSAMVMATQIGIVFTTMFLLQFTAVITLSLPMFFAVTVAIAIIQIVATTILVNVLVRPFHDLIQAVTLVAGQPTVATPNPNVGSYEHDGFKDILQTVYDLAAKNTDAVEAQPESATDSIVMNGIENTSTGIIIFDKDRKVVFHNSHAPVGKNLNNEDILQLIFPEDDTFEQWLERSQDNKISAERTWMRVANKLPGEKDRRLYDVVASYHKDNLAETILTLFDRTTLYTPEEEDLDFISFAAHELRGPITVIRGYLDVLDEELSPTLERDQAELIQRLIVAANRLTSYVNNILNASRYDRRHLKLHLSEDSVRHIYDSIADDMQLRASAQGRLLIADIPDNLPTVAADMSAVSEVFSNLIDNAIKYSNEGGLVHVTAHAIPGFIEVSVTDRGIGMPSSVLPNLFHKFYRSHRSRETVAGTGIGLYICKAIVNSHGGTITARSVENEGSTFSFTLPIYDTVADKLHANKGGNQFLIEHGSGWIRNHSMYRG